MTVLRFRMTAEGTALVMPFIAGAT